MINLRLKLQKLTQCRDLERQLVLMADLQKESNHNIKLQRKTYDRDDRKYNCYMYALDVSYEDAIKNTLQANKNIRFSKFIQGLISNKILTPNQSGAVIIYFEHNKPVHAGKFSHTTKRITSKWGIGHLWEHAIFEIPSSYGNLFKFFNPVYPKLVVKEFQEFVAKEQNK